MFPVPLASMPAVDMCWLMSLAGINSSAKETLKLGMKTTCNVPTHRTSLFTTFATPQASWIICGCQKKVSVLYGQTVFGSGKWKGKYEPFSPRRTLARLLL
jgi:hypothetical protein